VSVFGIYSYYGFFESIGRDPSEKNDAGLLGLGLGADLWKGFVFNDSKSIARKLFNSVYRSDDDDPQDSQERSRDSSRKFLENIAPQLYLNLDSSISWWQRRRIVSEKPFDADGKDCKNAFQSLFDKD